MRRILVVQLGDIGDMVLSTPALSALRERYPDAHIAVLTTPLAAPILDDTGLADEVITARRTLIDRQHPLKTLRLLLKLWRGAYDTILFFQRLTTRAGMWRCWLISLAASSPRRLGLDNGRGFFLTHCAEDKGFDRQHTADAWLAVVGLTGAVRTWRTFITPFEPYQVVSDIPPKPRFRRIIIHPGSGVLNPARRWDVENFTALTEQLISSYNFEVVIVGGKDDDGDRVFAAVDDKFKSNLINLTGKTTFPELFDVLMTCEIFIGVDSGVSHIAASLKRFMIVLFGPTNPTAWYPLTDEIIMLRSAPRCSPCAYVGHEIGARAGCAARTCMKMITVDEVLDAVNYLKRDVPAALYREDVPPTPPYSPHMMPFLTLLEMPVSVITYDGWMRQIAAWMGETDTPLHHVCTINPEMIMIARRDPVFRVVLRRADITVPDGIGLLWAARRLGQPLPERVTGSDGVPRIAAEATVHGWKLFFLGAAPGIAERAAAVLRSRHHGLQIVGTYAGSPSPDEEADIVERVNASGADILFVAYGAPEQDKWIARNSPRLRVKMAMGVGGTFDFIAGIVPRAPLMMQKLGMEWLYRLYLQPRRIGRMIRLPRFVLAVLFERTRK